MPVTLRYNPTTGTLCGTPEFLEACDCLEPGVKCDPCQVQMALAVEGLGETDPLPSPYCTGSNGNYRLFPTDTPSQPPAPPTPCPSDAFTDFICFLESDPFEITEFGNTETFRWGVTIAQHVNLMDWVVTVVWYNEDHTIAFWWIGTVPGNGALDDLSFCFGDLQQCANLGGFCSPAGTSVCGEAITTPLSRCDFQCPQTFQLSPGGVVDGDCDTCHELNMQTFAADVVANPLFTSCGFMGTCHWGEQAIVVGAGAGCPDFIETGVSIQPAGPDATGPPWHVFAFLRVRIDGVWHEVAWRRNNVDEVCCELDIEFTPEEICHVSEPGECDLTQATMHVLAGATVS